MMNWNSGTWKKCGAVVLGIVIIASVIYNVITWYDIFTR